MSDPAVSPVSALPTTPQDSSFPGKQLVAAALSAFLPGSGQLLAGDRRKARILLSGFVVLLVCVWPLRLLRSYAGLVFIILAWLALSLYASCTALFARSSSTVLRMSKAWLVVIPPLVYIGLNMAFTPALLLSGFRAVRVNSSAMEPTLFVGDQFIFDRNYYRNNALADNDLVVVRRNDYQIVKRVIAVGGEAIEAKNREILVNGRVAHEPFIQHIEPPGTNPYMDSFAPISVPAGRVFLMGDNRDVSLDSRSQDFGMLTTDAIIGKPLYIYRSRLKGRAGKLLQ